MKKSYYFRPDDDEYCYTEEGIKEYMQENCIKEMNVYKAKRVTGEGVFYCKKFQEPGMAREACGKFDCESYIPNNGKRGRCKHYGYCYEPSNEIITIKL